MYVLMEHKRQKKEDKDNTQKNQRKRNIETKTEKES